MIRDSTLLPMSQQRAAHNNTVRRAAHGSWVARFVSVFGRSPRALYSLVREGYRRSMGAAVDRRFRNGRSGMPACLELNLTRRCNLRCVMCRQQRQPDKERLELGWYDPSRELPLATWVDLLDQVRSFRPRLFVTGGEPLLYPKVAELLREAKRRKFFVQLQTNGTMLDRMAEEVVALGVEVVNVSLDGPPGVHDRIRTHSGAGERTLEGIKALVDARRRLRRANPLLIVTCVVSKTNLPYLDQMVPLAAGLHADVLQFQNPMWDSPENVARHNALFSPEWVAERGLKAELPSIGEAEYYQHEFTPDDIAILSATLRQARRQAGRQLKVIVWPFSVSEQLLPYYQDLDHPFPQKCNSLWDAGIVLPDGTVSPCLHVVAGNISRERFADIWNGSVMQNLRRLISQGLLPGCTRCCHRRFS
ncbi:MAG: radical SAM protein [Verrucomicrobia bacterium]|nr:radical SAM protein [Verrucomicrobiota bacterium]